MAKLACIKVTAMLLMICCGPRFLNAEISPSITEDAFTETRICGIASRQRLGCTSAIRDGRPTILSCAATCLALSDCYTFSFDKVQQVCYIHKSCSMPVNTECDPEDDALSHFRGQCLHDGTWNETLGTCDCYRGYIGHRCERLASKCSELRQWRYSGDMLVVKLLPEGYGRGFPTYCSILPSSTLTFAALYKDGESIFNRRWKEYKKGFVHDYDNIGSFCVGLENLNSITRKQNNQLLILDIILMESGEPTTFKFTYEGFFVDWPSTNYTVMFQAESYNSEGPLSDTVELTSCLQGANGVQFSTPDADHDQRLGGNCAAQARSGWWFTQCDDISPSCNLFGAPYVTGEELATPERFRLLGDVMTSDYTANEVIIKMYLKENY